MDGGLVDAGLDTLVRQRRHELGPVRFRGQDQGKRWQVEVSTSRAKGRIRSGRPCSFSRYKRVSSRRRELASGSFANWTRPRTALISSIR
jgi:hypothetical protein